jgi:hypothetical protein
MSYQRIKVLIWGKTYPELSTKYVETVCTGGLREDGTPIRLYPVPLRYLATWQQYRLYDWIQVPVEKSKSDPRPESFKVASDNIVRVGHIGTDKGAWRSRRDHIFRNPSWHFASIADLKAVQARDGRSMGLVTPGKVEDVKLIQRTDRERREYEDQMERVHQQQDAFRPEYKELEFVPHEVRLLWRPRVRFS